MSKNMKTLIAVIVVVLIAAGAIVMMSKDDKTENSTTTSTSTTETSTDTTPPPAASTANTVAIKDFAFGPTSLTVKVGTTVTWTNSDDVSHTVTADTISADAPDSKLLAKGDTFSFKFDKAGTYAYHCTPHPNMQGTVIVTE